MLSKKILVLKTKSSILVGGLAIVLFSTFVIALTALSMSAICSNGKQLKGGIYYVISRLVYITKY